MKLFEMIARVPSSSHNSPSDENGHHWPAGERFRLLSAPKQRYYRQTHRRCSGEGAELTYFEQVGGEEVVISIPTKKIYQFLKPVREK